MEQSAALDELPSIDLEEVREGDLIFNARPSPLQNLVELAGDSWRHVGIAVVVDGEMGVCEVSGHTFRFRPIDQVPRPPQTTVAIARFGPGWESCAAEAAAWAARMVGNENLYAWDDFILTGVLLVARQRAPASRFEQIMGVIRSAEQLANESPPRSDQQTFTCSSFIHHAYAQTSLECTPKVVFKPVRTRPGRFRDTQRLDPVPLGTLIDQAGENDTADLANLLEQYSILELAGVEEVDETRIRSSATSRMNPEQLVASVQDLIRIFTNIETDNLPSTLVVDERWVSPGDLWRLDEIEFRATLPIMA